MATKQRIRPLLVLSILFFVGASCIAKGWARYVSEQSGYSLEYPASWYRFDPGSTRFDILNFPPDQRIKGVVLQKNGAEILVKLQPKDDPQSLEDWIKRDLAYDQFIESGNISQVKNSPDGCEQLQKVVSRSEVAEGTYFINTSLYCVSKRRSMQLLLMNWEGDPSQPTYQAIAVRIAKSIRVF